MKRIFWVLLVLGIVSHAFSLAVLPDSAYSDTAYHLTQIKRATTATYELDLMELPLYYFLSTPVALAFPMGFPFTKIMPALVTAALFYFSYLLFRREFGENYIIPLAFMANIPILIRYGSVNYVGVFAAACLMAALYFRDGFSIMPVLVSKANAALVGLFMFVPEQLRRNSFYGFTGVSLVALALIDWASSYLSFFDFPPASAFSKFAVLKGIAYEPAAMLFCVMTLFIFIAIIEGLWKRRESTYAFCFMFLFSITALCGVFWFYKLEFLYVRWLIPVIPLISVFYADGLLSSDYRNTILASTILYCAYSFAMTTISAASYGGLL